MCGICPNSCSSNYLMSTMMSELCEADITFFSLSCYLSERDTCDVFMFHS